ncbi:MAG: cyclic-di-AMP receptor [Anaerolineae bacterium]|nr:cyclic-di-AMP receptor [Thermoflexales bacterium]MDW8406880.1 cyclic-di-AMP receptor [Anaerolineae bacterium]
MKLILAIVHADDATGVIQALTEAGLRVTRIATEGGWLRQKSATLLLGLQDAQVPRALTLLKRATQRRKVPVAVPVHLSAPLGQTVISSGQEADIEVGGATVFVLNVERLEQY